MSVAVFSTGYTVLYKPRVITSRLDTCWKDCQAGVGLCAAVRYKQEQGYVETLIQCPERCLIECFGVGRSLARSVRELARLLGADSPVRAKAQQQKIIHIYRNSVISLVSVPRKEPSPTLTGDWNDPRNLHSHMFLHHSARVSPNTFFPFLLGKRFVGNEGPEKHNALIILLYPGRSHQT